MAELDGSRPPAPTGPPDATRRRAPHLDRRSFVQAAAGALVAAGFGGCASLQTVPVRSEDGVIRLPLRDHPGLRTPDGFLLIQPGGLDHHLIVLAAGDEDDEAGGGFVVVSPICTHRGCTVDVSGRRLACPCHGSEYDRAGEVLTGPAERALTRYPAEVSPAGELVIRLGAA